MRLLLIIPTLDRGGAEKQLTMLACGLPRDEFEVHVCALTRGGPRAADLEAAGIPVHYIDKRWKADPFAYVRLKQLIRELRPDIVHTWLFAANAYGRQAAWKAGVRRIVVSERCVDSWKTWELHVDRWLAPRAARIATNSAAIRDFYVEQRLPAEKFVVIPNAIVPPAEPPRDRERLRAELGIPADARLLVAVGRLWPQKRYKDLIWAADLLKVVRDDVHLLIVGEGPQRWRLETFREQVRIEDRVHLLGERSDVPRLLASSDIYWIGSGYEGQSNAVMEAMSLGLPVVASDIPGNRELVVHEETGFLFPVGDRASLARWTTVLLDDSERAVRMGAAGRQRMLTEFSLEQMIRRHVELYRSL